MSSGGGIATHLSLALAAATAAPRQKRIALWLGVAGLVAFLAVAPFVRVPLPRLPAFIPAYQAALFFIDAITAVLIADQYLRLRSPGLLVLAAGYLFDALIVVAHTLTFPGAFTPTGLLGAGPQTTAWLYVFWHGGFALFVMAYARLRRSGSAPVWIARHPAQALAAAAAAVTALVVALTLLATRGHDLLPVVMQGSDYSMLVSKGISPAIWALTLVALAMLWQRETRVMDLWLMLVMWIWLLDIALSAVLGSKRFDLGFYSGRLFGLIAASFLLAVLLVEMARMYASAVNAVAAANRVEPLPPQPDEPQQPGAQAPPPSIRPMPESTAVETSSFIRDQNIAHFRKLLSTGHLSGEERHTITGLLAAEERRA